MHKFLLFVSTLGLAVIAPAQEWEIGGLGGAGFGTGSTVASALASATTGFKPGAALGVYVGSGLHRHWSGEIRYEYQADNLKLSAGSSSASFSGYSHAIHYDFLYHPNLHLKNPKVQPFVAAGAGIKMYHGTGKEQAYQPLSNLAFLTKTQDTRALFTVGGGVQYLIRPRVLFRAEVLDFITPFPTGVITPAPGAKVSGWINDIVPMFGVSYIF